MQKNNMIFIFAITAAIQLAASTSVHPNTSPALSRGLFAADLLQQIIKKTRCPENIIFSPLSIQAALAMTYLGAAGQTARELQTGLRLQSSNVDEVGKSFAQILNQKNGDAQLNIANSIFVSCELKLQPQFNNRSEKYFKSKAETLNFRKNPKQAIATINRWVEHKTNNKIKNVLQPGSVGKDTAAVIVNAIYFKGKWKTPFNKDITRKSPFWIARNKSVSVDTMFVSGNFKYGVFPELCATGIEMPYNNSKISMLLLLPTQRDGLAKMESKLNMTALNTLSKKMSPKLVDVSLPKFKIEFSIELIGVLKALGITSLFSDNANLSGIFQSGPSVKVSDVSHKGLINVNEAGSEAAAATVVTISPTSVIVNKKKFNVDHPFLFAIKCADAVYFVGHVVKL